MAAVDPTTDQASPDVVIELRAEPSEVSILPGKATGVWRYTGGVTQGRADALEALPNSYLGPTLRLRRGERVRVEFSNGLSEPTIVHWHGLHVPELADGHPRLAINPGETYTYEFTVLNRAGTYWYHPHPHGRTGPQVYNGMAGLFIVSDEEEASAGLPGGAEDLSLVIQDRLFTSDNQFSYPIQAMGSRMMGVVGNKILVNGQLDTSLPVATRPYRLRLLNGSNSRIYKLGWHDGRPLHVIATDGGLLDRPIERASLVLAPAERVELWVDLGADPVGSELRLENKDFLGSGTFDIARLRVEREETAETTALPDALSDSQPYLETDAVNQQNPRRFTLQMAQMQWMLNGRTFGMTDVADDETVKLGDLEVWEFVNESLQMAMPHPMHVHNVQFRVIDRQILPQFERQYQTVAEGYVDEGWKDTVLVMAGERVKVLLKFEDFAGLYLYHCHNLEHEDMGMMRNYRVVA